MNLRLILKLSLFGIILAMGSLDGITRSGWELAFWLVFPLVWSAILANRAPGKYFLHGFLTAFIAGLLSSLVQGLFMNQYLAHDPRSAAAFKALPSWFTPAVLVVMVSPITAALGGALTGSLTWLAARFVRPRPTTA